MVIFHRLLLEGIHPSKLGDGAPYNSVSNHLPTRASVNGRAPGGRRSP